MDSTINKIQMVDLKGQYLAIKEEIATAMQEVLDDTAFIKGAAVSEFEKELAHYCGVNHIVSCGNGTDALQIAMMALGFEPGDEVILPVHTYVATAEVIALLRLKPVFVDVDPQTFNIDLDQVESKITDKSVAIVPVHLYGQCADMERLLKIAEKHNLKIIEDTAQAIGAEYTFADGAKKQAGTMGDIGTTSFFPSKNLGCFGDGGAMMINDQKIADSCKMIANHGQEKKYHHDVIGVNSRLDTLQAAILRVKLKYLTQYSTRRQEAAAYYDQHLADVPHVITPVKAPNSTHVYHQYTLKTNGIDRDKFKAYLADKGIPTMIYYPVPLHHQKAYKSLSSESFPVAEELSRVVISLPIHTEMNTATQDYIIESIRAFGN